MKVYINKEPIESMIYGLTLEKGNSFKLKTIEQDLIRLVYSPPMEMVKHLLSMNEDLSNLYTEITVRKDILDGFFVCVEV